jgi:SAM-dependent methyltransferase
VPTSNDWDRAYATGRHTELWDTPWPAPELAGFVVAEPDRGRALDLGCGTGSDAILLAHAGYEVTGIDLSETAVVIARTRPHPSLMLSWLVGDVLDLPIADGTVDLATDRGCFHYLDDVGRTRYADEMARVLRPGGRLFLRGMTWAATHDHTITEAEIHDRFAAPTFSSVRTTPFTMMGANKSAPAVAAVVSRAHSGGHASGSRSSTA